MLQDGYRPLVPTIPDSLEPYTDKSSRELKHLQSWGWATERAVYINCDLSNAGLRGCHIGNALFQNCTFDEADLSETVFTECFFQNCTFIRTNLYKVTFQGCTLEDSEKCATSPFVGAGMAHIKFIPDKQSGICTSLHNLFFTQMGFRNGIFSQCVFDNTDFEYVSFEDSLLDRCIIDSLDITSCSCRAVHIKDCSIGCFRTNLDKLMSTIGIKELLKNSQFEIFHYDQDGHAHIATEIDEVCALIRDRMELLVSHGKFFEVFNFIVSFASEYGLEQFMPSEQLEQLNLPVFLPPDRTKHRIFSPEEDATRSLYAKIARLIYLFMQHGVDVSLDSFLYTLRLVSEYEIVSPELHDALLRLAHHLFLTHDREYMDNPTVALVQYYLSEMAKRIPTGRVQLCFTHPYIGFADKALRKDFFDRVDNLLEHALPGGQYRFEKVVQGSLDQFVSTLDYQKVFWFLLFLGIQFELKYVGGKCNFTFGFDTTRGIKSVAALMREANRIIQTLGMKGSTKEDRSVAEATIARARAFDDVEYFKMNNISGEMRKMYCEEHAQEEISRLGDSISRQQELNSSKEPKD